MQWLTLWICNPVVQDFDHHVAMLPWGEQFVKWVPTAGSKSQKVKVRHLFSCFSVSLKAYLFDMVFQRALLKRFEQLLGKRYID